MKKNLNFGFTLVELAIVLVIIGLLVSGVLAGQELITQARIRAIINEQKNYERAIYTFQLKYNSLPGDAPNAYKFFGSNCGTNTNDVSTGCNGDGDGVIEGVYSSSEGVKAWEHLSLAGLINGSYDGTGVVASNANGGVRFSKSNIPESKYPNSYWAIGSSNCEGCPYADSVNPLWRAGAYFTLGSINDNADAGWLVPAVSLSNTDAYTIDLKLDDGMSESGSIMGDNDLGVCLDNPTGESVDDYSLSYISSNSLPERGNCVLNFLYKK